MRAGDRVRDARARRVRRREPGRATPRRWPRCCSATYFFPFEVTSVLLIIAAVGRDGAGAAQVARGHAGRDRRARADLERWPHEPVAPEPGAPMRHADRRTSWCSRAILFAIGTRGRADPQERADDLHVGRAPAERREPRARRVLADARQSETARCWRSSPWWWRPPRSSSGSRSSCRVYRRIRRSNVDDARSCGGSTDVGRAEAASPLAGPGAAAGGRRWSTCSSASGSAGRRAWLRRGRWSPRRSPCRVAVAGASSGSAPRTACRRSICSTGSRVGAFRGRRRPPAGPAVGDDDPGRHGIGTLIHIYAIGYMHGDPRYGRFFAYLNLFVFFMLMLVLGQQPPRPLPGLGGRGALLVPADRVLVREDRERRTRRRRRSSRPGSATPLMLVGLALIVVKFGTLDFDGHLRDGGEHAHEERRHGDRAAAVRRRGRQVGAGAAARVAARRDGGPHARSRP